MTVRSAIVLAILLCIVAAVPSDAKQPPKGFVAGFGQSTADSGTIVYQVFGQSLDRRVVSITLESRAEGSADFSAWTAFGQGVPISADSMLWAFIWQPCQFDSGDYELRLIPVDSAGDSSPDVQPILHVRIENCRAVPIGLSEGLANAWFESGRFDGLGIVRVEIVVSEFIHSVLGVYESRNGECAAEKITLRRDLEDPAKYMGAFDISPLHGSGTGRFWVAANDFGNLITHLSYIQATIGCEPPIVGSLISNDQICARIEMPSNAPPAGICVVLYPIGMPTTWGNRTPLQLWPNCAEGSLLTMIQWRGQPPPLSSEGDALVEISYRATVSDECLTVFRWDDPLGIWSMSGLHIDEISGGRARFRVDLAHLEGIYAVASGIEPCGQQAPLPKSIALVQNYPNPFNAGTVIPFDLDRESDWKVGIFNLAGQAVRGFAGHNAPGRVNVTWDGVDSDGRRVVSGVYFYRLTAGSYTSTKKMTLLK